MLAVLHHEDQDVSKIIVPLFELGVICKIVVVIGLVFVKICRASVFGKGIGARLQVLVPDLLESFVLADLLRPPPTEANEVVQEVV
jgi:hypothetical protein